jgi:hypothetical protein
MLIRFFYRAHCHIAWHTSEGEMIHPDPRVLWGCSLTFSAQVSTFNSLNVGMRCRAFMMRRSSTRRATLGTRMLVSRGWCRTIRGCETSENRGWIGVLLLHRSVPVEQCQASNSVAFICILSYAHLSKQGNRRLQVEPWIIEPQPLVKCTDRLNLLILQVKISDFQVLSKTVLVVRLRNHRNITLRCPTQQNLSRRLANPFSGFLNYVNIPEQRDVVCPFAESGR